jgi:predicted nucleic acid-binding protein
MAGFGFYDGIEQHITPFAPDGWLHLIAMTDEELGQSVALPPALHKGERACLCIARQRGWGLLTDDWAARQQALAWHIPLSGTIGVLLLAIEDNRLGSDDANALLQDMIDRAHYRSPIADLGTLLS